MFQLFRPERSRQPRLRADQVSISRNGELLFHQDVADVLGLGCRVCLFVDADRKALGFRHPVGKREWRRHWDRAIWYKDTAGGRCVINVVGPLRCLGLDLAEVAGRHPLRIRYRKAVVELGRNADWGGYWQRKTNPKSPTPSP